MKNIDKMDEARKSIFGTTDKILSVRRVFCAIQNSYDKGKTWELVEIGIFTEIDYLNPVKKVIQGIELTTYDTIMIEELAYSDPDKTFDTNPIAKQRTSYNIIGSRGMRFDHVSILTAEDFKKVKSDPKLLELVLSKLKWSRPYYIKDTL
jgi:hypothetical protein